MKQELLTKLNQPKTIKKINALCDEVGLSDIYLYESDDRPEEVLVSFFSKEADDNLDLFILTNRADEIAKILTLESEQVSIVPEDMIAEEYRENVLENAQLYSIENQSKLDKFCDDYTVSKSEEDKAVSVIPKFELNNNRKRKMRESQTEEREEPEAKRMKEAVITLLKKEPEILEVFSYVLKKPEVLLSAQKDIKAKAQGEIKPTNGRHFIRT